MVQKRTREDDSTNRGTPDCWSLAVSANKWLPSLPCLGFTFWFSWNLIAFSGSVWSSEQNSALLVSYLFIFHLVASAVTHLFFAKGYRPLLDIIATRPFLAAGATIGSIGSLLVVLVGRDLVSGLAVFFLGSVLAGIGTTFMLVRSSTLFAQFSPRKSFLTISICALGAIFLYHYVEGYESILGPGMFVLLPAFSAFFLSVKINTASELEMIRTTSPLPLRFGNLIIAVFVYSLCQEVTKGYLLTSLSMSQSVLCMQYVMLALTVLLCVFVVVGLSFPPDFSFGKIFYPLAIFLIAPQAGSTFLMDSPVLTAAGIDFAGYGFDVFIWVMCAYLAFQTKANCVKIIGYVTAALSLGLAIGSVVSLVLLDLSLTSFELSLVNFVLVILCLVVTVIVFPEKKLLDLFRPVDGSGEEDDLAVRTQKAIWRQACERVADVGGLSAREHEVLFLISKGLSAQQIADEFTISIHTARTHIRNIHSKLGVSNRAEIIDLIESYKNVLGVQERS